jgi:hypothetical protein
VCQRQKEISYRMLLKEFSTMLYCLYYISEQIVSESIEILLLSLLNSNKNLLSKSTFSKASEGKFFIHVVELSSWSIANILHILGFKLIFCWMIGRRKFFTIITVYKCIGDTIKLRYLCDNCGEE